MDLHPCSEGPVPGLEVSGILKSYPLICLGQRLPLCGLMELHNVVQIAVSSPPSQSKVYYYLMFSKKKFSQSLQCSLSVSSKTTYEYGKRFQQLKHSKRSDGLQYVKERPFTGFGGGLPNTAIRQGLDYAAKSAQLQPNGDWVKWHESLHRQDYADQGMLQASAKGDQTGRNGWVLADSSVPGDKVSSYGLHTTDLPLQVARNTIRLPSCHPMKS